MQHQLYRELLVSDTIEYKKLCQVAVTRGVSHRITGHCVVASHISGNKAVFHTTVPCFRKCSTSMHFYSKHCSLFVAFETVQFNLRVNVESLACRAGIKLSVVKRRFETLSTNSKRPREEKKKKSSTCGQTCKSTFG